MALTHLFAGVATADYDSALAWYERLMGRPPDFTPKQDEAVWQVVDPGWIYLVGGVDRAGKALVTVLVDDLEEHVAELARRRVATGGMETVPGVMRKVAITDPEGNMITFGEDLSADQA